jgi:histidyl-tRNA synthetase
MQRREERLSLPRGISDLAPGQAARVLALERQWLETAHMHGFQPVRFPPVGFEATFTAGHHASGERIYAFADRRGRRLALAADSLASALRLSRTLPSGEARICFSAPIFRYERRPRRYFHHLGLAEYSRSRPPDPSSDAATVRRLLGVVLEFLEPIPIVVDLSDLGVWRAITAAIHGLSVEEGLHALASLPAQERPEWLSARDAPGFAIRYAESLAAEPVHRPGSGGVDRLAASLPPPLGIRLRELELTALACDERMATRANLTPGEMHASEFHDGIAFQLRVGAGRRIGDGGSYAAFAQRFSGQRVSLFSCVVGLERIAELSTTPSTDTATLMLCHDNTPQARRYAAGLANGLRVSGIPVWETTQGEAPQGFSRYTRRLGISLAATLGRAGGGEWQVHVWDAAGDSCWLPAHDLGGWVRRRLNVK